ncbi:thermonuclease family protein [Plasticicumulans acidivorans]|uniref:TNase-like domain-containing protein n=1 Tax=Plasticicumulans acidivorans TaxID=886464 RepID=A0A317N0D5_9GAMM|nr:thermonuclease family protein [Plasticicumulans acidivorans]PWV64836.1 hypothetical protein C7443_102489 [Plasticicumulans acidivorans]
MRNIFFAALCMLPALGVQAAPPGPDDTTGTLIYEGERVRLFATISPRLDQRCEEWRGSQPIAYACGQHARAFLQSLVAGGVPVCVRESVPGTATCYIDGRDIGEELVSAGWALARRDESSRYASQQDHARELGRGLWRGHFDDPTLPQQPAPAKAR